MPCACSLFSSFHSRPRTHCSLHCLGQWFLLRRSVAGSKETKKDSTAQRGPVQSHWHCGPLRSVRSVHDRRRKIGLHVRCDAHGQCTGVTVLARTIVLPLCGVSSRGVAGGGTQTAGHAARTSAQETQTQRARKHGEQGAAFVWRYACIPVCVPAELRFPASVRVSCPLPQEGKQPPPLAPGVHGHECPKLLGPARLPVPVPESRPPSCLGPPFAPSCVLLPWTPPVSGTAFPGLGGTAGRPGRRFCPVCLFLLALCSPSDLEQSTVTSGTIQRKQASIDLCQCVHRLYAQCAVAWCVVVRTANGRGWQAQCPAQDRQEDRTPQRLGSNGKRTERVRRMLARVYASFYIRCELCVLCVRSAGGCAALRPRLLQQGATAMGGCDLFGQRPRQPVLQAVCGVLSAVVFFPFLFVCVRAKCCMSSHPRGADPASSSPPLVALGASFFEICRDQPSLSLHAHSAWNGVEPRFLAPLSRSPPSASVSAAALLCLCRCRRFSNAADAADAHDFL
jgi:hypothetical protein